MSDYELYKGTVINNFGGERFEPSYHVIKYISNLTTAPWFVFCFIYAGLSVITRMTYLKQESYTIWGAVLVYISNIFVAQDMIAIRASVASAILLYSIRYRVEEKRKELFLSIVLATLFHYSALLFVILLIINREKTNRWLYVLLLIGSYVLASNGITFGSYLGLLRFEYLETHYLDNSSMSSLNIFNLLQLGHVFICLLSWIFIDRVKQYNKSILIYLKIYTIGLVLAVMFSDYVSVALRLSELMLAVDVFFIPAALYSLFDSLYLKKLSVFLYSIVILYFTITSNNYWLTYL